MEKNSTPDFKNGASNNQYTDPNASKKTWVPRKHGKKRELSPDKDSNKSKSPPRRVAENGQDEGKPKEELKFQPPPQCPPQPMSMPSTSTYQPNGYANSDYYAVDPSQNNYMMPQYNMNVYNPMNQWNAPANSSMPNMDMPSTSAAMAPFPYVVQDASMYQMMAPIPGYCPMPMMNGGMPPGIPQKVTKTYPNCTLVPPPPGAPPPSRRDRPNGCKTVFVGGLPEKITEEIVKEAFSECGEISTVRMSKKNFCHIRFTSEHHVDQAMFFSGYRLKVDHKDDGPHCSRLHVDFAVARDDQYEHECLMRTLSREARHAGDDLRPPSPPPIVNYSECEAATVGENLRNEETFKRAIDVLIVWLDRGECNKRNAGTFYSMIQSTYSHVRRLVADKTKVEDELTAVKQRLHQQSTLNAQHFTDIERVFTYALTQKVWDHFTKAQRKHIDMWKKQTCDTKMQNLDDLLEERIEDEMEMSDNEDRDAPEEPEKAIKWKEEKTRMLEDQVRQQEEIELLRSQLRTVNDEKVSQKDESDKKLSAIGDAYQLMQQNYIETKQNYIETNKKLEEAMKEKSATGNRESISLDKSKMCNGNCPSTSAGMTVTENEARLISLISTFLNVHPLGASIDYICSYLVKMDANINTRDVENLMRKFNTVFKEESTGIGATLEKKWIFYGYKFYSA